MAREKKVTEILRNAGYEPIEGKACIVKYAPENLSGQIAEFFNMEFYVLQLCKDSVVLIPFNKMTLALTKKIALEIPFSSIRNVTITEEYLNYRIVLETEEGTIALTAQQAEISELRTSGSLALGEGLYSLGAFKKGNWHRKNLAGTLDALRSLAPASVH